MTIPLFLAFVAGLAAGLALHGIYWPLGLLGVAAVAALGLLLRRIPEPKE